MASASRSDSGVVSTWKAIFSAHLGKELSSRASASRPHVLIAPPDAFDGLPIIDALPFKIRGQSLIKRVGHVLTVPLGIIVELRLTFGFDGHYVHAPKGKGTDGSCQGTTRWDAQAEVRTEQFKAAREEGQLGRRSQTDLPGASEIATTHRSNNRLWARAVRPIDAAQESQADTLPDLIENKPQPPIDPPELQNTRGSVVSVERMLPSASSQTGAAGFPESSLITRSRSRAMDRRS